MSIVQNHSLDAEESLLGAMLLSPKAIDGVIGHVDAADFYRESHGEVFTAMVDMHARGEPVDPVTLAAELEKRGKLERIGGNGKLVELAALTSTASRAPHYAKIVKDKGVLRGLHTAGQLITELAGNGEGNTDELIAKAEVLLSEAVLRNTTQSSGSVTDGFEELVEEWRTAYSTGVPVTGLLTHVNVLDKMLNGLWPGQLILLAARPATGKSALAQNIAENVVDFEGQRTLFVTLEMSKRELQTRGVSRAGRIDGECLSCGLISEEEAKRLGDAIKTVRERADKLLVDDGGMASIPGLTAEATRLHRQGGLGLIVVDYIQLLTGVGNTKSEEVGYISRGLKQLARRLDVPILALSQMNRNILARSEKRPDLGDLRDSGSLEQDADVVIFLHRDSDFDSSKEDDGSIECIVAKNRRGKTGSEKALFVKKHSSFLNPRTVPSS